MAISYFKSGEIISLLLGDALSESQSTTLVKTSDLELIRIIIPAGKVIPRHTAPGEMTVQCLEGRLAFITDLRTQELHAGQLLFLTAVEPHSLAGLEDSSILVTRILTKTRHTV